MFRRRRWPGRALVAALTLTTILALGVSPYLRSVDTAPWLHVIALGQLIGTAAVASLAILALLLLSRPRMHDRLAGTVASIVSVVGIVALVATSMAPHRSAPPVVATGSSLTVLSWNTGQEAVSSETLIALLDSMRPDVAALPEYFGTVADAQLAGWAREHGYRILSAESSTSSVLITDRLGAYSVDLTGAPPWAGFTAVPANPTSPPIVVVHAEHARLWSAALWREHVAWASRACSKPLSIAVGDFNATVQNLPAGGLAQCQDVAEQLRRTAAGTWPTWLPAFAGPQIDHVMTGAGWTPTDFEVLTGYDHKGSDHRPVLARLHAVR